MNSLASILRLTSFLVLSIATTACGRLGPEPPLLPNVVLIFVDDMGTEAGSYGNDVVQTPNIDRLAREGVLFRNAYTASPSCSQSRAAILTGRYPHSNGVQSLIQWHIRREGQTHPDRLERTERHSLSHSEVIIPQTLKGFGYATGIYGKWHVSTDSVLNWGFDEVWAEPEEFISGHRDEPFFYYHALIHTHVPFWTDPDFSYDPSEVVLPGHFEENPDLRTDLAEYYSAISNQDREIGRILDTLDREGLTDDTVVIFSSDNGPPYGRAKATLYEWGIREPLIIRYPGVLPASRRTDALASTVDVFPTILELLGQPIPDRMQGTSLVPVMQDPEAAGREAVFAELTYHVLFNPMRSVRSGDWKYIRNFYPDAPFVTQLGVRALRCPLAVPPRPGEELYDLGSDPLECRNLAVEPRYAQQLERMRALLEAWMDETDDQPLAELAYLSPTEQFPGGWFGRAEDPAPNSRPPSRYGTMTFERFESEFSYIGGIPPESR
jgi:arylsulfatase A-like enzyme